MDYFDQITRGCESNVLLLLGDTHSENQSLTKKALFKRNVEIINLELSYQCNRKCDYCPVMNSSRQSVQRMMPIELLTKICKDLAEIRYENRISLNLYNEPLLDKQLDEKIHLIKTLMPYSHVAFNTNGDKLTYQRLASLGDSGCDYICVTLHPPANKTQSVDTIRRRTKKLLEKISISTLPEIDFENQYFFQLRQRGVSIKVQWPDWRTQGTNRAGLLASDRINSDTRTQPCAKPFREFTVFYDGTVQPCCEAFHDDKVNLVPIGNLSESSVFELYSSMAMSYFRREVFQFGPKKGICETCTVKDYSRESDADYRLQIIKKVRDL